MRTILLQLATFLVLVPTLATATPPIADAGPDLEVEVGHRINLQGSATDADHDPIIAYQWTLESAPAGSTPLIVIPGDPTTEFEADMPGEYVLSLRAADSIEVSEPDSMTVTVYEILPPVAIATADVTTGPAPLTVNFDGSASTVDPRAGTLSYSWNFGDGQLASGISASHTYNQENTYYAKLTISDNLGQPDIDFVIITVGTVPAKPSTWGRIKALYR